MRPRFLPPLTLGFAAVLLCTLPGMAQETTTQALPLTDVVLFSSGVGYFQRTGRVTGERPVRLSFRSDQVNDVLKSMVLLDPAGGIRPVAYSLGETVSPRLTPLKDQLPDSVGMGALLRRFQGTRLRLETGGDALEGRLVSVHTRKIPVKDTGVLEQDVLNLLTDSGLRVVSLDVVASVRLLDERLDRELREALEAMARGLDDERRSVELRFGGGAEREVRAGYLQETPVWKSSYRLVLDKDQKPYLQGWAIVENTGEEDWKEVRLSLVSGRPISFIQDLYQPLYVTRPVVRPQVIASPFPTTLGAALEVEPARSDKQGALGPALSPAPPPAARALTPPTELMERRAGAAMSADALGRSVAAQAAAAERGELFEYAVQTPVTLERGKAAMVPIVSGPVEGEKLSVYDPRSSEGHALNAFRIKNTSGLHLSGGPVTVFTDGGYGGDAQIEHLGPGESRLLTYAVDLDLVPAHRTPAVRQETTTVSVKSGLLHITRKHRREHAYTFRNKGAQPRKVVVVQQQEQDFTLVEPAKPYETTASEYRFLVEVPAGKTVEFATASERPVLETVALLDADLDFISAWALNGKLGGPLRAALKTLLEKRRAIADLQRARRTIDEQLKTIDQEQTRIRQNMAELDRNSPLYQQYVRKLTDQEAEIERLRAEAAARKKEEEAAQSALRSYLDGLNVE